MTRASATKRKSACRISLSDAAARAGTSGPGIPAKSFTATRNPHSRYGSRALSAWTAALANLNLYWKRKTASINARIRAPVVYADSGVTTPFRWGGLIA